MGEPPNVLAEGGSGFHFFGRRAQKIVLRSRRTIAPRMLAAVAAAAAF
jgi:hypothetical protein